MFLRLLHSLPKVVIAGDVVPIEDCPRPVTGDSHRNTLSHTGAEHVAHPRSTQVMENPSGNHYNLLLTVDDLGSHGSCVFYLPDLSLIQRSIHASLNLTDRPKRLANGKRPLASFTECFVQKILGEPCQGGGFCHAD